MRRSARPIVIIVTLLALAAIAAPAGAAPDPEVGRDISYPQCASGSPHRHEASYAVLGVNGGRALHRESVPRRAAAVGEASARRARVLRKYR